MKTLKRIFTSIIRNPFQSISLFLIVFILGNVLYASIAIKQSSVNVREELKGRASSYISLVKTHDGNEKYNARQLETLVGELKENEKVNFIGTFETIRIFEPIEANKNKCDYVIYDYVSLENINNSFYEYEIIDGRYFTQEELDGGEKKILLPKELGYKVGDTFVLHIPDYEIIDEVDNVVGYYNVHRYALPKMDNRKSMKFKVIGLYENIALKNEFAEEKDTLTIGYEIPKKCMEEIVKIHQKVLDVHGDDEKDYVGKHNNWLNIDRKVFNLNHEISAVMISSKGIEANEELEQEILASEYYPSNYYKMITAAQEYRYIQGPLENLDALANVALGASAVLTVVLLALVSNLFIKYRTKEIGILMAIGEKKSKLLLQFVGEILIVGLLATSAAMISGNYLGSKISNEFMTIQIDVDSEMAYQESNPDGLSQIDLLETYEIEMNKEYIATIYLASTVILILSSTLPVMNIMKIKPKEVLL